MKKNQSGVALLELLLLIVVVAAVVIVGLRVAGNHKNNLASNSTTTNTAPASKTYPTVSSVPQISQKSDLDKAEAVLNQSDSTTADTNDSNLLGAQSSF